MCLEPQTITISSCDRLCPDFCLKPEKESWNTKCREQNTKSRKCLTIKLHLGILVETSLWIVKLLLLYMYNIHALYTLYICNTKLLFMCLEYIFDKYQLRPENCISKLLFHSSCLVPFDKCQYQTNILRSLLTSHIFHRYNRLLSNKVKMHF